MNGESIHSDRAPGSGKEPLGKLQKKFFSMEGEVSPEGEPRQEFENTRGCPTRVVPPEAALSPWSPAQAATQAQFFSLFSRDFPPAIPATPDFSTPDNKGGGGAAAAVTQRRARPRPAPPLPSGAAGPAPRVWRGRADTRQASGGRAGCGRSSPSLPPRLPLPSSPALPGGQSRPAESFFSIFFLSSKLRRFSEVQFTSKHFKALRLC
ncbi:protein FAM107B isoform X1 [Agelaius phoeniceus]|uniref:protein FAM107B isoform X1 n=1 Tax=Agelaius phoeniceus TaxID=39638 RepID=UPI004054B5F5